MPLAVLVGWLLWGMMMSPLHLDLAKMEAYAQMQRRDQQSWVVVWESRRVTFLEGQHWTMLEAVKQYIVLLI